MVTKVYNIAEASKTWLSGGTGDYSITLANLATLTGRQGARHDLGTTSRSRVFMWRFFVNGFETAPTLGHTVEIYAKTGDTNASDNDDGTGDIALSSTDKLKNCRFLGILQVDEALTGIPMSTGGMIELPERYFNPIIYNATTVSLRNSGHAHGFILTPWVPESQ